MNHEDHPGKVQKSDGPYNPQDSHFDTDARKMDRPKRRSSLWVFGLIPVVLICVVAMWMGHVSTTLADTKQMVADNGKTLSFMSDRLAGMQAQLAAIGQQLNQLQTELQNLFTIVMNYLSHKTQ